MRLARRKGVVAPVVTPGGERIYELIGRAPELGGATKHSIGYVVIPPEGASRPHYHPEAEETYFVLQGEGRLRINGKDHVIRPGDAVFIQPLEDHQIFAVGEGNLEFIVVCAPAWEPSNSVFLDE